MLSSFCVLMTGNIIPFLLLLTVQSIMQMLYCITQVIPMLLPLVLPDIKTQAERLYLRLAFIMFQKTISVSVKRLTIFPTFHF